MARQLGDFIREFLEYHAASVTRGVK
ncbi:hypothetical protein Gohar_001078, partial [Gossypium harknessii]|nr:hypothetical protein [Gossypium harknessii]